ncbi:hypothetical protein [Burkholderia multivorans]|uniref:hypothetical protein n=1 Tax=Burkholderia multivorans TaxID=87883 RepID=UPI00201A14BD|nr:hypothetical protein [Burkholderia multivorans]MCL4649975.1 hypothetical protein [Burkholderia multivorans]MCL4658837.1 hypothetical protein [Burkholderia multivorans]MCO1424763.1 hypothetical protein [Burkholderia multivorans]UQN54685.1 hypothetical protein L0Y88_24390 [Burkholderia multivorans]UQN80389.1 hypothetical protein L0Z18_12370 [Burkholderia multivorans]
MLSAQDLDVHKQLVNASHGVIEPCMERIGGACLPASLHAGKCLITIGEGHTDFARHGVNGFAARQAKGHASLPPVDQRLASPAPGALPVALRASSGTSAQSHSYQLSFHDHPVSFDS